MSILKNRIILVICALSFGFTLKGSTLPELEIDNIPLWDTINGPDNSKWYYTSDEGCIFTFYDNGFNEVGRVCLPASELKNTVCNQVMSNFISVDGNPLIIINSANGSTDENVIYTSGIYEICPDLIKDGFDEPLFSSGGKCVNVALLQNSSEEPTYFVTFDLQANERKYLNGFIIQGHDFVTYTLSQEKGFARFFEYEIEKDYQVMDTYLNDSFMTKQVDGNLYLIYSKYEKPLLSNNTSDSKDISQTPDNNFIIEIYKTSGGQPVVSSISKIPVRFSQQTFYKYVSYSIGKFAGEMDVDMSFNATPSSPLFIINKRYWNEGMPDVSYYDAALYDSNGKELRQIIKDYNLVKIDDSIKNEEPLMMLFDWHDGIGPQIEFRQLYSGVSVFKLDVNNNQDPIDYSDYAIVRNEDGSLNFVFQMTHMTQNTEHDCMARIGWFATPGTLDHIDTVNLGKSVEACSVFLSPEILNAALFDNDHQIGYPVKLLKTFDSKTQDEIIIANEDGAVYAKFTEADGRGKPAFLSILEGETNLLLVAYKTDNFLYNVDIYTLPLSSENNTNEIMNVIDLIHYPNCLFDLMGRKVTSPQPGSVYIRNGKKFILK